MPTLFKRSNGIYYTVVSDQSGHRRWVSTGQRTKSLALENLKPVYNKEPKIVPVKTLEEFRGEFMEYAQQIHSPGNIGVYQRAFSSFLKIVGDVVISAVNPRSVDQFKAKRLSQGISKSTLNLELRSLRAAFQFALRWELIPDNPFKGVRLLELDDQTPAFFSVADFKNLIGQLPPGWFRDIVLVGALTGMRRGEMLNLRWDAVDMNRRSILIRSTKDYKTKRGKKRAIPMNDEVLAILGRRLSSRDSDYVFTDRGKRISNEALSLRFKRKIRQLKLDERLHFHSLRHSFASWLIQSGSVSIFEIQKLLGHSNIKMTEIYSHLLPDNLLETVNRLPMDFQV